MRTLYRQRGGTQRAAARRRTMMSRTPPSHSDAAVSDVVANILMVAITVVMVAGLAIFIGAQPGPQAHVNADIKVVTYPNVTVQHLGGVSIPMDKMMVIISSTNHPSNSPVPLSNFVSGIGNTWSIGDGACLSCYQNGDYYKGDDITSITVVAQNAVVASWQGKLAVANDGSGDVVPPPVATFTSTCTENLQCKVDASRSYSLDGTALTYAWKLGGSSFTSPRTSPTDVLNWTSNGPKQVTLRVTSHGGRVSDTVTRTLHPLYIQYVQKFVVPLGTAGNAIGAAQHEDRIFFNLTEAISGRTPTYAKLTPGSASGTAQNPGNVQSANDGRYATFTVPLAQNVVVGYWPTPGNHTIASVDAYVQYLCVNPPNGQIKDFLAISDSTNPANSHSVPIAVNATNASIEVTKMANLTADAASWSASDVQRANLTLTWVQHGGNHCTSIEVDGIWLRVKTTVSTYDLVANGYLNQTVTSGAPHYLELGYLLSGTATYKVVVGGATVGPILGNEGLSYYRVQLTTSQYNGGVFHFTIQSVAPATDRGRLLLDYVRVVSS